MASPGELPVSKFGAACEVTSKWQVIREAIGMRMNEGRKRAVSPKGESAFVAIEAIEKVEVSRCKSPSGFDGSPTGQVADHYFGRKS